MPLDIQDNHPEAQISCLDLSPYYLAEARRNLADWARLRDTKKASPSDVFIQAAAENIPVPDNSYDAVGPATLVNLLCCLVLIMQS